MIISAHQTAYLPWAGFFHKIALADVFVSLDNVQFEANSWSNRNRIKTASGLAWMTVPVRSGGHLHKACAEIEIAVDQPWQKKHWKTLESNYRRARFWGRYADFFHDVYLVRRWTRLVDLNDHMLRWFLDELGIRTPVVSALAEGFSGHKNELIIDICRRLDGTVFIYGEQGRDYATPEDCRAAGFTAYFQSYAPQPYPQLFGDFAPYLGIVDILLNCGGDSLDIIMAGNDDKTALLRRIGT
jgi:hypothetical protein